MMKRDECLKILKRHVNDDDIVVSTYSSAFEWLELGERTMNYFSVGAMGLDSSHYEANGGHPIPNNSADFATMAKSAGYPHTYEFSQLANFEQQAGHIVRQEGPVFATLRVEPSNPINYDYARVYDAARREAIRAALRAG
jgi:sulfopyruvate decarboxylase subunit beta